MARNTSSLSLGGANGRERHHNSPLALERWELINRDGREKREVRQECANLKEWLGTFYVRTGDVYLTFVVYFCHPETFPQGAILTGDAVDLDMHKRSFFSFCSLWHFTSVSDGFCRNLASWGLFCLESFIDYANGTI